MLAGTEINEVYMFNSGRPLAAISFAMTRDADPATTPGSRKIKGAKEVINSTPNTSSINGEAITPSSIAPSNVN